MRLVLRIGGSVVGSPINGALITKYTELLARLRKQGHDIVTVVGGGTLARELIIVARELGLEMESQDELAILASRLVAELFRKKLRILTCNKVSTSLEDVAECLRKGKIAIMGGLKPGITTDSVAALVAEYINADLIVKGTNQDGVFDKDPRKHKDALKLDHLLLDDLCKVLELSKHQAGMHQIIDPVAIEILKRKRIKVIVVNGFNPDNVLAAVNGEKVGTLVD